MSGEVSLNGTLSSKILLVEGAKVETQLEPSVTFASGKQTVTITHELEGYESYLLHCPQYGIADDFFVYVKDVTLNQAELYILNNGEEVTASIGNTIWLCIPILDS